jgi:hypothetical protein
LSKVVPLNTLTRPINRDQRPNLTIVNRSHTHHSTKTFNLLHRASKNGRVPENNYSPRSTHRGGVKKIVKVFGTEFSNKSVIKIFTFCFLQANHCTLTLFNLRSHFPLPFFRV